MIDFSATEMRVYISNLLSMKRNYRQEIKDLTESYPYVVFYGCGAILSSIVESWDDLIGRKIDYFCDSDSRKWGKTYFGAKCISPDELLCIKDKCVVFVTIGDFKPVYDFLVGNGFPSVNQLYKYDIVASEYLAEASQEDLISKLCEVYGLLADRQSRRVFNAIVTRVLGDGNCIDVMLDVCEGNQYFPADLIALSDSERIVDIGAFDGDTIRDFSARTKDKFGKIFSFELDAVNYKSLRDNLEKFPEDNRIETYNLGIWDSDCAVAYSIGESQSTVGSGPGNGRVVPLDSILHDEAVTFIKMDIEGAEPNALRGARGIIQNQMPTLAVCIYHDFRHLWEIPLYIKSIVSDYKIYLRHHTNLEYETVCYAIRDKSGGGVSL